MSTLTPSQKVLRRERWKLLIRIESILEVPMNILAFIWLILTVIDLTKGLSSIFNQTVNVIWIVFWIHFIAQLILAPSKTTFLKHNWLTALSLILPALRIFRMLRFVKYITFVRGSYLVRIISSVNRGMNVLRRSFGKKGFAYVISLTLIIVAVGAAGMMSFEKEHSEYFQDYGSALWWTSMIITTMGSDYFPVSSEGRLLTLLLAIYGFAIFGYVTASVASFFIGKDEKEKNRLKDLEKEIKDLKRMIKQSIEIKE